MKKTLFIEILHPDSYIRNMEEAHDRFFSIREDAEDIWSSLEPEDLPRYAVQFPWDAFDFLYSGEIKAKFRANMLVAYAARRYLA
jgi:hypothetical protein